MVLSGGSGVVIDGKSGLYSGATILSLSKSQGIGHTTASSGRMVVRAVYLIKLPRGCPGQPSLTTRIAEKCF